MKIAFLSFYKGVVARGVETFVDELATRLSKDNDVTVFQSAAGENISYKVVEIKSDKTKFDSYENSVLRKLFLDKASLRIAFFTLKCFKKLIREDFDIIIPTNGGWQTLLVKFICLLKRSKMVVSGQSGKGFDDRWNILLKPSLFVALSNRDETWAKKHIVNVANIPNGVDLNKFSPKVKPTEIPLTKPIVLCVSALTTQKRVELVIEAISRLKNVSLLIIGHGDQNHKNAIEELGKTKLSNRFLLMETSHEKIASYYRASDVFTLPSSSSESFGIVLLEAMATNLPVVVTDDEIRKEIVGKAGYLVDPTNSIEYSLKLEKALSINWGNIPRQQAEKYSWDKISERYEEELKKL